MSALDIIIPVYNEKENIVPVLNALNDSVRTDFRVVICYDREDDDTLPVIRGMRHVKYPLKFIKNEGIGVLGAVMTGIRNARSPVVLVMPADDDYNAGIIDDMVRRCREGRDIVMASRFLKGGSMKNAPLLKFLLTRLSSLTLHVCARVPATDATNGFRMFSKRFLDEVAVESTQGWTFSLELLVKGHRLRRPVAEVPARWIERVHGKSRFRLWRWLRHYLVWYFYAFGTTYMRKGPESVMRKSAVSP